MKEREILNKILSKEYDSAFNQIVDLYSESLYWHIRLIIGSHNDADDVMQDVYYKIWRALPKFKAQSKIFTWVYRIATNESLNFLRKRKIISIFSSEIYETEAMMAIDEDPSFNGTKLQRDLHKAILELPQKQKLVFEMRYYQEMTYEEISAILGTSVGALKASYHIAYKKVQQFIEEKSI